MFSGIVRDNWTENKDNFKSAEFISVRKISI